MTAAAAAAATLHLKHVDGVTTDDVDYVNMLPSQMNVGTDDVYPRSLSV